MGITDYIKNWWSGNNKPTSVPAPAPKPVVNHHRVYDFELPYTINSFYVRIGVGKLQGDGLWDGLPQDIQNKLANAANSWSSVEVTKEELDTISDTEWTALANMIGLSWHTV